MLGKARKKPGNHVIDVADMARDGISCNISTKWSNGMKPSEVKKGGIWVFLTQLHIAYPQNMANIASEFLIHNNDE